MFITYLIFTLKLFTFTFWIANLINFQNSYYSLLISIYDSFCFLSDHPHFDVYSIYTIKKVFFKTYLKTGATVCVGSVMYHLKTNIDKDIYSFFLNIKFYH